MYYLKMRMPRATIMGWMTIDLASKESELEASLRTRTLQPGWEYMIFDEDGREMLPEPMQADVDGRQIEMNFPKEEENADDGE